MQTEKGSKQNCFEPFLTWISGPERDRTVDLYTARITGRLGKVVHVGFHRTNVPQDSTLFKNNAGSGSKLGSSWVVNSGFCQIADRIF